MIDDSGDVTIEAETPAISTFIVSTDEGDIGLDAEPGEATETPGDETPADDDDDIFDGTETPSGETPPADADDQPGFGALIALIALLAAALLAARRNARD